MNVTTNSNTFFTQDVEHIKDTNIYEITPVDININNEKLGEYNTFYKYKYINSAKNMKKKSQYFLYSNKPKIALVYPQNMNKDCYTTLLSNCNDLIKDIKHIPINTKVKSHQSRTIDIGILFIPRDTIYNKVLFDHMKEYMHTRCTQIIIVVIGVTNADKMSICNQDTAEQVYRRTLNTMWDKILVLNYNQIASQNNKKYNFRAQ